MTSRGALSSVSQLSELLTRDRQVEVGRIVVTGITALLFWRGLVPLPVLLIAVGVGLYPLVKTGVEDFLKERKIGTEIFVTIATLVAIFGGETVAGAILLAIILIAEFIADLNTDRARASIKNLIGSVPQAALVRGDGGERTVAIAELRIGDVVLAKAGERIPVDGTVVSGAGAVNEAPVTGESIPKDKATGASVFAGTILVSGALDIGTEKVGTDTTFARIIALVEQAEENQAPVAKLADRVASWLIPVVLVFLVLVFLVTRDIRMIVTLMIFTSPAELGLATPLVMIAAIARAAKSGILVKGGAYLESLAKVDAIVFDKTGTLTVGRPRVIAVVPAADADVDGPALLRLAAAADRRSGHPLAKAVVEHAAERAIEVPEPSAFEVLTGRGVRATVEGGEVLVGNARLLVENGIAVPADGSSDVGTKVFVASSGRVMGLLIIADEVRDGARKVIDRLKATGIKRVVMLTGDNQITAAAVGAALGIDDVRSELLPEDKVKAITSLRAEGYRVAMVGDGINDAPALATADVGIAMGAGGTQAALEAADVALMTDDLSKIALARAIARRAYRTIQENLFVGVGVVHVAGITAALLGLIGPIQAALIHLGPDVLVFVNSVKLLRVRIEA